MTQKGNTLKNINDNYISIRFNYFQTFITFINKQKIFKNIINKNAF